MHRTKTAVLAAFLAVLGGVSAVRAQGYDDYPDPDIRQTVARLAYMDGDVAFARGDDPDDWQPANPNVPMTLGDRAWTADGRLELQVHGGNLIRLASSTDLTALNLTEDTKQFSLSAGVGSFRIRRLGSDEVFEVDTPNAAVTFERVGDYRIDVRRDGDTRVQVRSGRAIVASGGGQVALGGGDAILIEGFETPRYDWISSGPIDGWDRWVDSRDVRYANVRSYQYVSPDIAGVEDLDHYGSWRQISGYGWCWTPASVTVGWRPYRAGRWMWQDPWGWTWVSAEPWGWAPYHYGRWVVWGSRWYWVPVAPTVTAVAYSPALVAFVGGGPGFSVSVGVGTDYIGWFPLAPRDPLIPWWGRPAVNVNVNVTNVTYVNRTYVTVVNQQTFVSSRSVTNNIVKDRSILSRVESAPVVRGAVPVVPTRQSIRVATRQAASPRPPAAVASRTVVTRMAPPPAPPRFDEKVAVIRENRGRPVTAAEADRIVTRESREAKPARAARPAASESGRVTLAPKMESSQAPRPEPVAPVRGRPLATKEQPVAPARGAAAAPDRPTSREVEKEQTDRDAGRTQPADRQPASSEQMQREQAQREQAQREEARREQAQREEARREQLQREQAQREQTRREEDQRDQAQRQQVQAERQQAQREQAQREQAQRERAQSERKSPDARPTTRSESPERSTQPRAAAPRATAPREPAQPAERVTPAPQGAKESASPDRGRGRPTPKPTKPPKKDDA